MGERPARVWVGIDAGKRSKKIDSGESAALAVPSEILELTDEVHWLVDSSGTSSSLLLALLAAHSQQAVYVPGRTVNRRSGAYRGEAKSCSPRFA